MLYKLVVKIRGLLVELAIVEGEEEGLARLLVII